MEAAARKPEEQAPSLYMVPLQRMWPEVDSRWFCGSFLNLLYL